jgi:uncharacterized protein involved in exopolysaccharide biosynthesis
MTGADLEFSELTDAIRRGGRRLAIGAGAGVAMAVAVLLFAPVSFEGRAMLLVRTEASTGGLVREQFGALAHLAGDALGLGEGGDKLKTEIALLRSRALLGDVVDSLALQVRAGRRPAIALDVQLPSSERFAPTKLDAGEAGTVRVVDREDAIDDLDERINVRIYGGETVEIGYRARDSVSAAMVPNLMAARYMERRKTVDRGLNQRRVEFLAAQMDSVRDALAAAARTLRGSQEEGRVVSLELSERAEVEQRIAMQARLAEAEAELVALEGLLREIGSDDPRRLAGFPALLRSPAVNELVAEMGRLATERYTLLAERTERAPEVMAIDSALVSLRGQLMPIATTYAKSLTVQRDAYREQVAASRARSAGLPRAAESLLLREAEVEGLGRLALAVNAQLLDARLAALGEGGDVRVVDPAVTPRRVAFPRPLPTLAVGLFAGLALGLLWALVPLAARSPSSEP